MISLGVNILLYPDSVFVVFLFLMIVALICQASS